MWQEPELKATGETIISIHTPHTRCDTTWACASWLRTWYFNPHTSYEVWHAFKTAYNVPMYISIHTPHTRCDTNVDLNNLKTATFQSTHLIRGVTRIRWYFPTGLEISIHTPHTRCDYNYWGIRRRWSNFNPHTSYEVWRLIRFNLWVRLLISIHTPHTRCDKLNMRVMYTQLWFQSTHLIRGVTSYILDYLLSQGYISIHTPHTRCDS